MLLSSAVCLCVLKMEAVNSRCIILCLRLFNFLRILEACNVRLASTAWTKNVLLQNNFYMIIALVAVA